jgi:hypothetical protein
MQFNDAAMQRLLLHQKGLYKTSLMHNPIHFARESNCTCRWSCKVLGLAEELKLHADADKPSSAAFVTAWCTACSASHFTSQGRGGNKEPAYKGSVQCSCSLVQASEVQGRNS